FPRRHSMGPPPFLRRPAGPPAPRLGSPGPGPRCRLKPLQEEESRSRFHPNPACPVLLSRSLAPAEQSRWDFRQAQCPSLASEQSRLPEPEAGPPKRLQFLQPRGDFRSHSQPEPAEERSGCATPAQIPVPIVRLLA